MKKILVIEDNLEVRENICELLELSGYEVIAAPNGKEGVKESIAHHPDLIVCDVMMPVLDGYGALKILQKNRETTHIPFIFLTAKADKGDFRRGMNLGADDYITKPFDDVEFLEAIEIRLNKKNNIPQAAKQGNAFNIEGYYEEALAEFIANKEVKHYHKKEELFEEGHTPKMVFWLKKGKAQTYKINDWGKELVLSLYNKGEFVGIEDAFRETPYQESANCIEDCEVVTVPKDELLDWIRQDNNLAQYFIKVLSEESSEKDKQLIGLAYDSVREKVAASLVKLHKHYHEEGDGNFEINILREDLSHIVGIAKETVTRTLSEFKSDGLIDVKGSKLALLDIEGLRRICS